MEKITRLSVTHDGKEKIYLLRKLSAEIGRASSNDVVLLEGRASRRHARLTRQGDGWQIEDLASANGTRVNGQPITRATIGEQDTIEIGGATLRVQWTDAPPLVDTPTLLQATVMDSLADLDQTLSDAKLEVAIPDTTLPRLAVRLEGRVWEVPMRGERLGIGRAADNDVVLAHEKVSRHHAALEQRGDKIFLVDQNSSNGTFIGSERISECLLRGDEDIHIGGARLTFKPAFHVAQLEVQQSSQRHPVVVVPGFMGSQLWRGDDLLWPDLRDVLRRPDAFRLPDSADLTVRGIVDEVVIIPNFIKLEQYTRLVHFLTDSLGYVEGKDLHVFVYDWRKDLRIAARKLADEVAAFRRGLADPHAKITILAHSMGCLVTRYYVDRLGGDAVVARCVLMGGPQLGIPKFIVAILAGLSVLPFGMLGERLRRVISTFPSAYQTLPTYACVFDEHGKPIDVYADDRWLLEPFGEYLRDGLKFRHELSEQARVPTTCIFGYGVKTVSKVVVQVTPDGRWDNPKFIEEANGDNTIPDASAILKGADIHPVQQQHGALFTDADVKMRLKLELTRA